MHAGDALWRLYGCAAMLQRLCPADARVSFLTHEIHECAGIIGAHISVPEPTTVDFDKLLESLRGELPAGDAPASTSSQQQSGRADFSDAEVIKAAQAFVGAMVDSQLFGWATMVSDINDKLQSSSPFFTFKQARAIVNIADRGEFEDGGSFMDTMENDQPDALAAVKVWADQA